MRSDGRGPSDLRPVRITPNVLAYAEGSALIELGQTRVLCAATADEHVPAFLKGTGRGWITAEYALLPRATQTRTPREVTIGRPSGRTHEIQRLIGRSLRAAVDLDALGERQIIIDCDVLQADGGTRTAAITGGYVALALAVTRLVASATIPRSPIRWPVAAISVGIVDGVPMLDLRYDEDARADVDFNVVQTGDGRLVEVQGTAEHEPFGRRMLDTLLDLAARGIQVLLAAQAEAIARGSGAEG